MEINLIIEIFCAHKGIDPSDICKRGRNSLRWSTRYMIWYYLHTKEGLSAGLIAKKFNRTRNNVFKGLRIVTNHMRYHKDVRDEYREIVKKIEGMTEATPSENMEDKD